MALVPQKAFADVSELPQDYGDIPYGTFTIPATNAEIVWHGVNGTSYSNILAVPSKGTQGGWSYEDFLDLYYRNVGSIQGRAIDLNLHFDKIEVTTSGPGSIDGRFEFASLGYYSVWFNNTATDDSRNTRLDNKQFYVDITATVTYSDNGELVDYPFYAKATDIDVRGTNQYFCEAWKALSGFDGKIYTYQNNALTVSNDFRFSANGNAEFTSGANELIRCGVIGRTNNGQFSFEIENGQRTGDGGIGISFTVEREIFTPEKDYVITE